MQQISLNSINTDKVQQWYSCQMYIYLATDTFSVLVIDVSVYVIRNNVISPSSRSIKAISIIL